MREKSRLAGKTVRIKEKAGALGGQEFRVEDWFENVVGRSWMDSIGNPTALGYAVRIGHSDGPGLLHIPAFDNDVLYGKIGMMAYAVNIREIEGESDD